MAAAQTVLLYLLHLTVERWGGGGINPPISLFQRFEKLIYSKGLEL